MKTSIIQSLFIVSVLSLLCVAGQQTPAQDKSSPAPSKTGVITTNTDWLSLPRPGENTLRPAPHKGSDIAFDSEWVILPKGDIYEVVTSQVSASLIRNMPGGSFKLLTEAQARSYTGHYYKCPAGKRPCLVPAVYAKKGVGQFRAERRGNSLAIIWAAGGLLLHLWEPKEFERSAVVMNLDFTPDMIYNDLSAFP